MVWHTALRRKTVDANLQIFGVFMIIVSSAKAWKCHKAAIIKFMQHLDLLSSNVSVFFYYKSGTSSVFFV